jgi:hypothetical protein
MNIESTVVTVPTARISDWTTFHHVFKEIFGFPNFYGCNMNAWIDCMTSIDVAEHGMSTVTVERGGVIILSIENAPDFQRRCLDQYEALLECSAFVNYRRTEVGDYPVLALMLSGHFRR